MKTAIALSLTCGVLIGSASRTAAATGEFVDQFEAPTLKTNWQSAICVNNATPPMDWGVNNGILRGHWTTWGQEHLTVEGPTGPCTVQVRCRLDRADNAQSGALLVLRAEDPAIKHPGVGAANFFALGIGNGSFVFGRVFASTYDFPKTGTRPSLQVGTWHTLKAEINGTHIRCFVDDEPVYETDDSSFSGNHYGVGAALYADVSFDDFQITTPPPVATSRAVGTGQFIDIGWPPGTGNQETVTFMIVAEPASTDSTNPAPAQATVVMDSPAIQKLFGNSLVLQGTPEKYVENALFTQDPKLPKELYFKTADKLIMVGFNDNSLPGNNPDPNWADYIFLSVTNTTTGNALLVMSGPLTRGDVMDYVPMTTPSTAPTLSVSTVMRVSWPYSLTPFSLEGTDTVDGSWKPVDTWVIDQGGEHQTFLPLTSPMKFFRLVGTK